MFQTIFVEKIKHTFYGQYFFFVGRGNHAVYEIIWKNIVELDWSQKTIWRMRIACWKTGYRHPLRMCNTYFLSTANVVTRTLLNLMLYVLYIASLV